MTPAPIGSVADVRRGKFWLPVLWIFTLAISLGLFLEKHWGAFETPPRAVIYGWDDWHYYLWLPTVVEDRDADFRNQYAAVPNWDDQTRRDALAPPATSAGLPPNKYAVGWACASAPWYLAGSLVARSTAGTQAAADGLHPWQQWFVMFGQWLYGVAGLAAAAAYLAKIFSGRTDGWAVLFGWWCSSLLSYQTEHLSMVHSQVFVLTAVSCWLTEAIIARPQDRRLWLLLGLAGGLMAATRNVGVIYLAYPVVLLSGVVRRMPETRQGVLFAVAGGLLAFAPELMAWKTLYGSWWFNTYQDEGFDWLQPHLFSVLFSPRHGWIYWHPAMLLGLAGLGWALARAGREKRLRAAVFLGVVILAIYLNGAWRVWWFGSSFGNRAFDGAILGIMFGLAWVIDQSTPRHRTALFLATSLLAVWNLNLLWLTRHWPITGLNPDIPVTYGQIARATARYYASPAASPADGPPQP